MSLANSCNKSRRKISKKSIRPAAVLNYDISSQLENLQSEESEEFDF